MKKLHFTIAMLVLWVGVSAQPQGFNYQALVRDNTGAAVKSHAVGVRIRIHPDSANGVIAYAETFTPNTNTYGNINLMIGKGAVVSGTFSTLDWSRPMYVEIGVDVSGGTSYADLGTTPLMSVPYALYAGKSGAASSAGTPTQIQNSSGNTSVQTEKTLNENIIHFNVNGMEKLRLDGSTLKFVNTGRSVFIGDSAGVNDDLNNRDNVFVGQRAGYSNTTGYFNTFCGANSGYSSLGLGNTFLGASTGYANTTGGYNTFTGIYAGLDNTTGTDNTFIGSSAGPANISGYDNSFTGNSSGYSNTTGYSNTFIGSSAGYNNATGNYNTFIGSGAGMYSSSGNNNIYIGNLSGPTSTIIANDSGNIFIGKVQMNGSRLLAIDDSLTSVPLIAGNFAAHTATINGGLTVTGTFTNPSDRRLKENIQPLAHALEAVQRLNGVYYTWKPEQNPNHIRGQGRQIGVIAQDVEKVYPELVSTTSDGYKAVDYLKLTAVLIEAVKEQQTTIQGQAKSIQDLQAQNAAILARVEKVEATLRLSGSPENSSLASSR